MASDRITLTVPARSDYAKTARMTAAELAGRIGMSFDHIDDVRMAAEEAFVYACGHHECEGEITFSFEVSDELLAITVGPFPDSAEEPGAEPEDRYAAFILESVCDEFTITRESGLCTLRLVKRSLAAVEG
ncbi:MAG: ATP-binding protein [Actinobacteria bacterium HGW-Actinobacteria-6]|nr:MAG: ATP-binding protein [Actinobacteria bacterium HGW-Actinobacteria-6]